MNLQWEDILLVFVYWRNLTSEVKKHKFNYPIGLNVICLDHKSLEANYSPTLAYLPKFCTENDNVNEIGKTNIINHAGFGLLNKVPL